MLWLPVVLQGTPNMEATMDLDTVSKVFNEESILFTPFGNIV